MRFQIIKKLTLIFVLILVLFAVCSCTSMRDFYEPWYEEGVIPEECFLKDGEEPKVYYSSDLDSDIYYLRSNYFMIIGDCTYNGPSDSSLKSEVLSLCRDKGATIGLYGYNYTGTNTGIYSTGRYITSYNINRYDYQVYLFVPMPDDLLFERSRIGMFYIDMDSSERLSSKRNVGAYVSVVYEDSPAFYANISRGDVISEVNGVTITSASQLDSIFNKASYHDVLEITLYRGGLPFTVSITPLF